MLQIDKLRTRVLVVSRSAPNPYHGSTMHMEDFIRYLTQSGCEVHYLALCAASNVDLSRSSVATAYFAEPHEVSALAFDAPLAEGECRLVDKACRKIRPAMVIADYSWMGDIFDGPFFRENPSVRKVIFVHDLRVRIMPSYVTMGLLSPEHNTWTDRREGELLAKADVLLTLNEEDKRAAQAMAPGVRVLKMGMSVSPRYADPSAIIPGRCIYVASDLNENLFSVMWLLQYAWPRVMEASKSASLIICGSICDGIKRLVGSQNGWQGGLKNLNVSLEGRVDDLGSYYASAQIALVPHWMMGGIKIKHIEAIAHGLAVVCTPPGADGLPDATNYSALIGEMPDEFSNHIINLMQNGDVLERMRGNSRNLALRMTPDAVYREVVDYLRET